MWADEPRAAVREAVRIDAALDRFATAPIDGVELMLRGGPRPVRRHDVHPFHVYYERRAGVLYVIRLHHHARRPVPIRG